MNLDTKRPKILVVDDYASSRLTLAALLSVEGYEVIEADSGLSALECVRQHYPDLILLDVMMPEMDGFEVCCRLKQEERTRQIPVIFITALCDRRSRIRGLEVGGSDFITKPFDQLELAARVRSLVHQKRLNEEIESMERVLLSIAQTVEDRETCSAYHSDRLAHLTQAFGHFLGLTALENRDLLWGAYLHDIGKIGIPDRILLKTERLTPDEWLVMQQHVTIGVKICEPLHILQGVTPIVRSHHERWDGSGYPDQLKGDRIPHLAQIFQIVDIYDALTSDRPHRPAYSHCDALEAIATEALTGWRNPQLVRQFSEFMATQDSRVPLLRGESPSLRNTDAVETI
ncbi:response regulator [Oscillatoria laete-virens NRMC-F 0139]|nr:response regulator [Oscillatoria laete-virens NRMC-F 0139]